MAKALRNKGKIEEIEVPEAFPKIENFNKEKLPLHKEVIGLVKYKCDENRLSYDKAISEVASILYEHWNSRNVYCITIKSVSVRIKSEVEEYRYLARTHKSKKGKTFNERFKAFREKGSLLFDVFCKDENRRKALEEQYGIPMLQEDYAFLHSMRTDRLYSCQKSVDKQWHDNVEVENRKYQSYVQRQHGHSETSTSLPESVADESVSSASASELSEEELFPSTSSVDNPKTRARFVDIDEPLSSYMSTRSNVSLQESSLNAENQCETDEIPQRFRHVRESERMVKDEIYQAIAELDGYGFSYRECQLAILVTANTVFGRQWKMPVEDGGEPNEETQFDI